VAYLYLPVYLGRSSIERFVNDVRDPNCDELLGHVDRNTSCD